MTLAEPFPFAPAFRRARARTESLFALLEPEAYLARPIPLRHPFVFYDGHLAAFNWNTLFRKTLGVPSFNPDFDARFARGIDPEAASLAPEPSAWPSRAAIQAYKQEVAARLDRFLANFDPDRPPHPWLQGGRVLHILLEHELMHHETLLYLIHQLPAALKRPQETAPPIPSPVDRSGRVAVPEGRARLGARAADGPFTWDNESPCHEVSVPAFQIDATPCTNGQFLDFVEAGGYQRPELWEPEAWAWRCQQGLTHPPFWLAQGSAWAFRDLFETIPLPLDWPVLVSHAEASAYARFTRKHLPTEAEWHRAAFGDDLDRPYPWGWDAPGPAHGNFDFQRLSPLPVGSFPQGASPFGVLDLLGNGWEWTSSPFAPFEGFMPDARYPHYSADFFDGKHVVLKGGSWVTDAKLLRGSFRNWFYRTYPYAYATFRCVSPA
ncbi:Iron(II)-dependent oxidoreductase EgtB [compost metagenome]